MLFMTPVQIQYAKDHITDVVIAFELTVITGLCIVIYKLIRYCLNNKK